MLHNRTLRILGLASLALAAVLAFSLILSASSALPVAAAPPAQASFPANTITVTGFGQASGSPDVAHIQLGIDLISEDLGEAVAQASAGMEPLIEAIRQVGVAAEDIQTTNFNVWAEDRYDPERGGPTGERVYHVSNAVRVTVRGIDQLQAVIDAAIGAGANNIYGLSFDMEDPAALEEEARLQAIEDARQRAGQIAEAIGATLGDPIIVEETGGVAPFPEAAMVGMGGGGGGIQEGQLSVSVQLDVTFSISR